MRSVFLLALMCFPLTAFALEGDPFAESVSVLEESKAIASKENAGVLQHLHGWLESRNQLRFLDGRAVSTRQRLWLEGEGALSCQAGEEGVERSDFARFFLSGSFDFDPAAASLSRDHNDFLFAPQEAYLTFEGSRFDILLGQKMVRWGTGDGINPLDLINPLDYRDPLASGRSDNRLPVFLAQGIVSLPAPQGVQEFSLEAVVVPLARVNTLNSSGSAWELPALQKMRMAKEQGVGELAGQEKPETWLVDGKYALRLTATTEGWDFGVAGYYGVKNGPVFVGVEDLQGKRTITPQHPNISAFGFTFAKGLNRSTVRGELAIKPRYPLQKKRDLLPDSQREDMLEGVIGFDRTFSFNRYLNVQYFATFIPESENVVDRCWSHGVTYEVSDLFVQDDLKLGVSGIVGFSGQGWTMQPYCEYQIGDNWLLAFSALLFEGSESGSYGQFSDRDFLTLRLRWSF